MAIPGGAQMMNEEEATAPMPPPGMTSTVETTMTLPANVQEFLTHLDSQWRQSFDAQTRAMEAMRMQLEEQVELLKQQLEDAMSKGTKYKTDEDYKDKGDNNKKLPHMNVKFIKKPEEYSGAN